MLEFCVSTCLFFQYGVLFSDVSEISAGQEILNCNWQIAGGQGLATGP